MARAHVIELRARIGRQLAGRHADGIREHLLEARGDVALRAGGAAQARGQRLRHEGLEVLAALLFHLPHGVEDRLLLGERLVELPLALRGVRLRGLERLCGGGHRACRQLVHLPDALRPILERILGDERVAQRLGERIGDLLGQVLELAGGFFLLVRLVAEFLR